MGSELPKRTGLARQALARKHLFDCSGNGLKYDAAKFPMARTQSSKPTNSNASALGFEATLWATADKLCDNLAVHGLEGEIKHGGDINSYYYDPHD